MNVVEALGRPRRAATLAVAIVSVLAIENGLDFPLSVPAFRRETGYPYLDMCAFCSSGQVLSELSAMGERGRLLQGLLFGTIDILIPGLSCLAGIAVLSALTQGYSRLRYLWLVPAVAAPLDLLENASIIGLLLGYPHPSTALAAFQGFVSGVKFVAYAAVLVAALFAALTRPSRRPNHAG